MKAYIICILFVTLLNFINEYILKNKSNKFNNINKFLFVISLLVPCIIAGARDITVGTDVRGYVLRLSNVVSSSPNIIHYLTNAKSDFLFSILVYIGFITRDFNVLLFFIELAVALPIYLYAYLERDKFPFTITILLFLLTMYCLSLSMMRQSISIAICILSYHFIEKKEYKKSILLIIVASLFHKTGIIFITFLFMFRMFNNNSKKGLTNMMYVVLSVALLFLISPFIDKIIGSSMYSNYLTYHENFKGFSILSLVKKLFFVVLWLFCVLKSKDKEDSNLAWFGLYLSIISLFCVYESFTYSGMGRIGYYFTDLSNFIIIREIIKRFKQKYLVTMLLLFVFVFLWWNMTCVPNDPSSVYPYTSSSFDFLN